ncbi:hypothetical protein LWE72_05870 [Clostridioides difficile]|uniref:hypothetical protein n=1 Tax=Clostridioides difficile TaxID=1496 RepID=UPI00038D2D28|nr:hypothetical protein [Clostridioides difficile]EQF14866.1 hypothetical protein QEO_0278 [Clostridioides difficile CD133]MBG0006277.1 hypothetical protein [Clostridioides difficile]MBG0010611.1 hypothetical protein [Clostridioides difficile]MBH6861996.1 hypothetical protein [Clostridioides difficile]MBH7687039.1 hypothetical protein [Clostridioides difficile]
MKDILGREIQDNDLVVAKGTGRHNKGLRVGLIRKNSIKFEDNSSATYTQLFKIINPSPDELKIKENILKYEREYENAKNKRLQERKSKRAIPKKNLELGKLYLDDRGRKIYYLGTGVVTKYEDDWVKGKIIGEGIIVVNVDNFTERHYGINLCYDLARRGIDIRKTIPRFVEDLGNQFNINGRVIELLEETEKDKDMYGVVGLQKTRKILIELKTN